mgnify:CR=1 FL=1
MGTTRVFVGSVSCVQNVNQETAIKQTPAAVPIQPLNFIYIKPQIKQQKIYEIIQHKQKREDNINKRI